jgi:choline dehydrogenase-like flavoprotein
LSYLAIDGPPPQSYLPVLKGLIRTLPFDHPRFPAVSPEAIDRRLIELGFQQTAGFGVMLVDSVGPDNRGEWDRMRGRKPSGTGSPSPTKHACALRRARALRSCSPPAREVVLPSEEPVGPAGAPRFHRASEAAACDDLQFRPHQTTITSAHCQATVKMGEDPRRAGINSRGESHLVRNLLVCDSSAFPTSCGANPMVSILTMARYQGRRIAAEMDRYDL